MNKNLPLSKCTCNVAVSAVGVNIPYHTIYRCSRLRCVAQRYLLCVCTVLVRGRVCVAH